MNVEVAVQFQDRGLVVFKVNSEHYMNNDHVLLIVEETEKPTLANSSGTVPAGKKKTTIIPMSSIRKVEITELD